MRVRGYPAGAPCWAEVASPDPATTRAFYGSLFGWNTNDDGQFTLDGRAVPMAVSAGWYSRVADPTGAHFAIIELSDDYRVD